MNPHRIPALLLLLIAFATARAEEPDGFDRRGFYLHGSWVMEHPFAVRSWTRDDMAGMFRLLRHIGFNHVMLWPTPEVAPMPLSDEDSATLRSYRGVIDDAHNAGLKIWLTYCPTVISTEEVRGVPWADRSLYATTREVRLIDEDTEQAYLKHRSTVLRLLGNADAFVVIDGDPGSYTGAPLEEYLRILASDQRAVPGSAIIPWIWSGWGRSYENNRFWGTPIAPLVSETYTALKIAMPANWEVMPGRSHREDWANGRTTIALAEQAEVVPRCTLMCYEIIEFEPTPPASVLQFDLIRNVLRQESKHVGIAKGVFGNAQQPLMVLPNLYFFARAAFDLRYLDRAQEDVLADLARELGGDPKVLGLAWSCLDLPLEKLPADLVVKVLAQKLTTDFAKCIPGGPRRYVEILAAQVQSRRQLLQAVAYSPKTVDEAATRLAEGSSALIRWWHLHHYVGRGKKGDVFRWDYVRSSEVSLLRDLAKLCRQYGASPFEQAALRISNERLLSQDEAAERINELSPPPAPYLSSSDVVVYTATAGGVTASIAAALEGANVVLVEPGLHLGEMLSSGLGHFDGPRQKEIIGGLAIEVYQRIAGHYGKDAVQTAFSFEPHVAEQALKNMLTDAGVRVAFGERIDSVTMNGARITSIKTQNGATFSASVFIDAGYEGDLMAKAGVRYSMELGGRRMTGETELTQRSLVADRKQADSIGMRSNNIDIPGNVKEPFQPWQISYRAILPKSAECENLLVPVCNAMSTIENASFRMEPIFMVTGQAAGTAAGLAVKDGTTVQTVDVSKLQATLREQGQILESTSHRLK